ncbi:MAG: 4Fe-4S dicluster domain-containing protein, partial [Myxococcales bacterium]|nr:4Fe-4S dicluster domain-containing protein [Myxococcales bacterium]
DEHPKQDKAALEATWTSARIREATATGSVDEWLSRGIAPGSALPSLAVDPDEDAVNQARQVSASVSNLCLELAPDPRLELGERQDNDWLQELPDPITRLCWGNALFVPDAVAKKHDLSNRDMVELRAGDVRLRVPIWIKPGQAERTLSIWLGHGERAGVDAAPVRSSGAPWLVRGIEITPLDERDDRLVCVQSTTSQEGRPLALSMHLSEWRTEPERLRRHNEDPPSLHPKRLQGSPQWGMVIDLNACTGCSVCVLACQAENNTPSVGPADASLGRAMHWLRIDRYFAGDSAESMAQPMACQHCEKAPCEYVCPVGATTHSPDGLNEMTYNRCVGTRFCSNNCPYKVRRFNWREYAPTPGERRVLLENPNVTVRARGVMEKCTYCVQRIRRAEIDCKLEHRELRDGDVATACEQACPTRAIVFGDISDPRSRVSERRGSSRLYGVLAEEGTRPRTRYLARIKNSPEEDT